MSITLFGLFEYTGSSRKLEISNKMFKSVLPFDLWILKLLVFANGGLNYKFLVHLITPNGQATRYIDRHIWFFGC